ncbi:unnamed protein product [Adineta steineri]|uniref:Uncharacterized protein n=1 Tax=Adineta steineri TaxID=433720 RepID=A0A815HJT6_9BILA|nr:unnamed protein product [Adineta steineri]CAF1598298.1 unnamed protein product [Adineta steineri]
MAWFTNLIKSNWSSRYPVLISGGLLIILLTLSVITIVLISTRSITIHQHNNEAIHIVEPSFNITYIIVNDINSPTPIFNFNSKQISQNLENALKLPTKNILQLEKKYQNIVKQAFDKRPTQCTFFFPNINDTLLTFQFHLKHSFLSLCKNQSCLKELYSNIYEQLQNITYFTIEIDNEFIEFNLCSIINFPYTENSSTDNYDEYSTLTSTVHSVTTSSQPPNTCQINSTNLQNKWIKVGNMFEYLMYHRSTYVPQDNSVLITGGTRNEFIYFNTIQKYIISNQSFVMNLHRSMKIKRALHSADLLPLLGLVLLTGGTSLSTPKEQLTAELLDPISGEITSIEMLTNRRYHTSVVIPLDNKVLLLGGHNYSSTILSTGDLFNGTHFIPIVNTMMVQRIYHTATYIPTINKILIIGGRDNENNRRNTYSTIEFYDVETNMFEILPNITMSMARARHTATYIPFPKDQLLIIGGENNDIYHINSWELFDIKTLSFIHKGTIQYGRFDHHATLLNNNHDILITDGFSNTLSIVPSEIFNLKTMLSCQAATMNKIREAFTTTLIPSIGEVFVCGGRDISYNTLNSCELYTP